MPSRPNSLTDDPVRCTGNCRANLVCKCDPSVFVAHGRCQCGFTSVLPPDTRDGEVSVGLQPVHRGCGLHTARVQQDSVGQALAVTMPPTPTTSQPPAHLLNLNILHPSHLIFVHLSPHLCYTAVHVLLPTLTHTTPHTPLAQPIDHQCTSFWSTCRSCPRAMPQGPSWKKVMLHNCSPAQPLRSSGSCMAQSCWHVATLVRPAA